MLVLHLQLSLSIDFVPHTPKKLNKVSHDKVLAIFPYFINIMLP